ncbi:MAG: T9SS type A sorting domain-containing protein [Flavobacteriales bacterium]|nr:T9SS type A sorting domain-containing protein [Flavobacteriales bacterium]MCB9365267.1 T9SS type A sorting domain-containing protein [Flavobacteriales bacterium]
MNVSKKLTSILVIILVFTSGAYTQCLHSIGLSDTYGDGWNGGTVTVSVNGTPVLTDITMATATVGPESFTFMASTGDAINVIRTNDGSYPSEMRIEVFNGIGGSIIALQQPPASPGVNGVGNCGAPMAYASSTTTQASTAAVCPGSNNKEIIGVQVVVTGASSPLDLTQIRIRTNGSSAPITDISNIDIYYTGTSSTYATTTLFGSVAPQNIGVNIDVVGTQTLVSGTNYFWVVYDIAPAATATNLLDARCTRITLGGTNYVPSITNPAGTRTITSSGPDCGFGGLDIGVVTCAGSPYTYSDNTTGANDDCTQRAGADHMYTFTLTVASDVTITNCDPTWDGYIYLYNVNNANCSSGEIASNDDSGCGSVITQTGLGVGTYVILIEGFSGGSGAYDLTIAVSNCQNSGDDPCDAITIVPGCGGSKVTSSTVGLTDSGISAPSCGTYSGGDIWFSMIVPASGTLKIEAYEASLSDMAMSIYSSSGTCAGAFTEISCDDNSGFGNMPKKTLSGQTPGNTLYVRLWDNNNDESGNFEIDAADLGANYCVTGNSVDQGTGCAQLTSATNNQLGSIWDADDKFDFTSDWTYDFTVNLGSSDAGADGICFVIQNDPAGLNASGTSGGAMGSGGILNSLIVEIDTYLNTEDRNDGLTGVTCGGGPDPDHLDIWLNGSVNPGDCSSGARVILNAVELINGASLYNIENGLDHIFRVSYVAATQTFTATVLNAAATITYGTVSYSPLDPMVVFGSNAPYFGFTGSTGGLNNQQSACLAASLVLPITLTQFNVTCKDGQPFLSWNTSSEINNDYFTIERSNDAINFIEVDKIVGAGNSNVSVDYNWQDDGSLMGINYYRLKQTDFDGKYSYSEMGVSNCKIEGDFNLYPNPFENKLIVQISEGVNYPLNIEVRDYLGREVFRKYIETESLIVEIDIDDKFQVGTYFVQIFNEFEHHTQKAIKIK